MGVSAFTCERSTFTNLPRLAPEAQATTETHLSRGSAGRGRARERRQFGRGDKPDRDGAHQRRPADVLCRQAPRSALRPQLPSAGGTPAHGPATRQAVDDRRRRARAALLDRPASRPRVPTQVPPARRAGADGQGSCRPQPASRRHPQFHRPAARVPPRLQFHAQADDGCPAMPNGNVDFGGPQLDARGTGRLHQGSADRRRSRPVAATPFTPATTGWGGPSTRTARPPPTATALRATSRAWCSRCTTGCSTGICTTTTATPYRPTRRRSPAAITTSTYGRYSFCEKLVAGRRAPARRLLSGDHALAAERRRLSVR